MRKPSRPSSASTLPQGGREKGRGHFRRALHAAAALILASCAGWGGLSSCSNIDCPLDNVVMMQCNLYSRETMSALTLSDVLTIQPAGRDTVLLNEGTGISSFLLPLKEAGGIDTLVCFLSNAAGQEGADTLFVSHTPQPHFESVDCPACVFHTLTGVRFTSHPLAEMPLTIDSVAIVRPEVNYDDIENLRIFLRATSNQ